MINKRASISSIAEIAGVSPATVSRVLNHPETVRPDTLEKVRNVLKQYGFRHESNSAPTVQAPLVLVCLPTIANPFYGPILKGIRSAAHARGFHILVLPEVPNPHRRLWTKSGSPPRSAASSPSAPRWTSLCWKRWTLTRPLFSAASTTAAPMSHMLALMTLAPPSPRPII